LKSELVNIFYQGESGASEIRTMVREDILYISLKDILITLNKENRELNESHVSKSMAGILKAQLQVLESDEHISVLVPKPKFEDEKEIFVTQPGLYRVLSGDRSQAGKKFQKWLYHEVIPSLTRHGIYPPPPEKKGSALTQMAEVVAQNSRMIADTLARQDAIQSEVNDVKDQLGLVVQKVNTLSSLPDYPYIVTVRQRYEKLEMDLSESIEEYTVAWCDNLSINQNIKIQRCASGDRLRSRYRLSIIDQAISMVADSK